MSNNNLQKPYIPPPDPYQIMKFNDWKKWRNSIIINLRKNGILFKNISDISGLAFNTLWDIINKNEKEKNNAG